MPDLRRSARIRAKTNPRSPCLKTSSRGRNYHIESQADREDREYAEMMAYKFQAHPPPDSSYAGSRPTGIPSKKIKKVTRPKTPNVVKRSAKAGIKKAKGKKGASKEIKRLRALPLPDLKKVYSITKAETQKTVPEPFSFEKKYAKPVEVKAKLLQETLAEEKKKREFKATPLFESEAFSVDKNLSKTCTRIEPFNITNPDAYQERLRKAEETREKENIDMEKKREFKSTFPHTIYEEPYIPEKMSRLCEVEEFNLHSEKRGEERRKYDEYLEQQRQENEEMKRKDEEEADKRERREVKELRKRQVHKANEIGEFKEQGYHQLQG